MAKWESLASPGRTVEVDPTSLATRISLYPLDHVDLGGKLLGQYRSRAVGTGIAPAANAILSSLRWNEPEKLLVLLRVSISITVSTVITVAQRLDPLLLFVTRAYRSPETTLNNPRTFGGDNQKMRSIMGTTLLRGSGTNDVSSIQDELGAAGISGGTRTDDANPIGSVVIPVPLTVLGQGVIGDLYKWDVSGQCPLILAAQEGLLVKWGATAAATGVLLPGIEYDWAEVLAF